MRPETTSAALSRRQLLSIGSATAVALAAGGPARAVAKGCRNERASWIPPAEFMAELPDLMKLVSLPGVSIAVVEDGDVVWSHVVGVANAKTQDPLREDSSFEAASMSKPVFAYVVMRLVDEKLIDLDRPLVQYRRPDWFTSDPNIELITARDVLRHSTGLPNWRQRPEDRIAPAFKPGTRYRYSGEGFFWLQLVVEKLTGQGLDSVAQSRLFGPAGLSRSTFAWNDDQDKRSVYGHKGPGGDDEGQIPFQMPRELARILLPIAKKWGKPMSGWTYEDVVRAVPEARVMPAIKDWPQDIATAPIDYLKLPTNILPNSAATLRTTPTEYARFMALMMTRSKRAAWEISEESCRAMRLLAADRQRFSPSHSRRTFSAEYSRQTRNSMGTPLYEHRSIFEATAENKIKG